MNKRTSGIFAKVAILLSIVIAIFTGGYFFLDKAIVPKYFGQYGINGIKDLVGVVSSLYGTPDESKFVTNAYTQADFTSAVTKLQTANYLIASDGTILEEEGRDFRGNGSVKITDREFAAICDKLLQDNILVDALPDLNYLNIVNISLKQVVFVVDETSFDMTTETYTKANISFIAKIDTSGIREQIALQMKTPIYLLKMIIPDYIYFGVEYEVDLTKTGEERIIGGSVGINSRSAKQSEIVVNLLIDFIFPAEANMTIEKFTVDLGEIVLAGIDFFGEFKFINNLGVKQNQAGIWIQ